MVVAIHNHNPGLLSIIPLKAMFGMLETQKKIKLSKEKWRIQGGKDFFPFQPNFQLLF